MTHVFSTTYLYDKAPNLAYIFEQDYQRKIQDLFENPQFTKVENFKIETELVSFRLMNAKEKNS
jgi:hypothetical protein